MTTYTNNVDTINNRININAVTSDINLNSNPYLCDCYLCSIDYNTNDYYNNYGNIHYSNTHSQTFPDHVDKFMSVEITSYNIHDINVNKGDGVYSGFIKEMCYNDPVYGDDFGGNYRDFGGESCEENTCSNPDDMIDIPYSIQVIEDFNNRIINHENINFIISFCDWLMIENIAEFIYKNVPYSETDLGIWSVFTYRFAFSRFVHTPNSVKKAIILGNLKLLTFCIQPNITPLPDIYHLIIDSASFGRIDCYEYLISLRQNAHSYIIAALQSAIQCSQLDFIQYIIRKNPFIKEHGYCFHLFEHAVSCNQPIIAEYFIKMGSFKPSSYSLSEAIVQNNMTLVILCVVYGAPIGYHHFQSADAINSNEIYNYLKNISPEIERTFSPTNIRT